ncbi:hypothetical protein ACP3TG_28130 [Phytobacter diazotrophicus]|nr:hypothetical protein [Enterobacter roggenkampii]
MKKYLTKIIGNAVNYGLLFVLVYSVFTGSQSLTGVTASAYWVIMALALFIGPLFYIVSYAAKSAKDADSRNKALELVADAAKKKNTFLRTLGWVELIITSALLAYAGWIFTSVLLVLSSLWLRLFISMARDNITSLEAKDKILGVN